MKQPQRRSRATREHQPDSKSFLPLKLDAFRILCEKWNSGNSRVQWSRTDTEGSWENITIASFLHILKNFKNYYVLEGKNVENSAKMQERTKKVKMLIFICIVKKIRIRSRGVENEPKWVNSVENAKNQKRSKKVKLRFSRIVIAISENPHLLQLRCVRPWWWKIVWYLIDGQSKAKTPWITDKRQSKSIWKTFFQFWIQNGQKWPCFWKTFCPFYALG